MLIVLQLSFKVRYYTYLVGIAKKLRGHPVIFFGVDQGFVSLQNLSNSTLFQISTSSKKHLKLTF